MQLFARDLRKTYTPEETDQFAADMGVTEIVVCALTNRKVKKAQSESLSSHVEYMKENKDNFDHLSTIRSDASKSKDSKPRRRTRESQLQAVGLSAESLIKRGLASINGESLDETRLKEIAEEAPRAFVVWAAWCVADYNRLMETEADMGNA